MNKASLTRKHKNDYGFIGTSDNAVIYYASEQGLDDLDGAQPFAVVCATHGEIANADSLSDGASTIHPERLLDARQLAADTTQFCQFCQEPHVKALDGNWVPEGQCQSRIGCGERSKFQSHFEDAWLCRMCFRGYSPLCPERVSGGMREPMDS